MRYKTKRQQKVSKSIKAASKLVKSQLRDINKEEVFYAEDGSRLVYYPPMEKDDITTQGWRNPNCQEFNFETPNGAKVSVINLKAFSKDIFGSTNKFYNLIHSNSKSKEGWIDLNE